MANYRLYIDESGTHNYPTGRVSMGKQYLSLTGIMVRDDHYKNVMQPKVRDIKLLVAQDPDELPILHREDIINKRGDFIQLRDPAIKTEFDRRLLELLGASDYILCNVVLDKVAHLKKYGHAAYHPYHYCLNVLLEKYIYCLHHLGAKGDVMAEARGGQDDRKLEREYRKFYRFGTQFLSSDYIQSVLMASDIKMRRKELKIEGLEIADLLTLPGKLDVLNAYGLLPSLDPNFQTKIIRTVQPRYYRDGHRIKGFGKKLLG